MIASNQTKYDLPEYEIILSINLQFPIRIKPEVSIIPLIYKDKNIEESNYQNNPVNEENQVDLNQLDNQFLPQSMSPQQTTLVKQIMAEVVFPEDFQHTGTIVREIVAKVVSIEDCESEYVQQVSVYRLPDEPVRQIHYEKSLLSNGERFLSLDKQSFVPTIKQKMPQEKITIGRAMDAINDGFAFVLNTTASVIFLGKVVNYSWE
jgi:hypothetical protein